MNKYEFTLNDGGDVCNVIEHAHTMVEAVAKVAYTFNADLIVSVVVMKE